MNNPYTPPSEPVKSSDPQTNNWAMILHLSVFAGVILPLVGIIAPIVIWQIKKEQLPGLDQHGRIVANWMISAFIYGIISLILCLVGIGFILLWILGILGIVFPIIGGIKANNGEVWPYPMSLKLF